MAVSEAFGPVVITVRPVRVADAACLLTWRNAPRVVAVSRSGQPVDPVAHGLWVRRTLEDASIVHWMAEVDDQPVGVVRVDPEGTVSLTVAPEWQGRGIGWQLLEAVRLTTRGRSLRARIHRQNLRSRRLFTQAGFLLRQQEGDWWGYEAAGDQDRREGACG